MRRSALALLSAGALMFGLAPAMLTAVVTAQPAAAESNGLALTPPMGFNDWNAFGCNTSATLIEQTAAAMVANGMAADGYKYVNIDDCWLSKSRDASGNLVPDPAKFPGGIKPVADYVHSLGLRLGIYEDAGTSTCAGYPGSLGHERQDASTFASWGVDYLKYDQCNIPFGNYPGETHEQVDQQLYRTMSSALNTIGRPILFSMCNGTDPAALPWLWGAPVSNLWRTTGDIQDNFASMVTNVAQNARLAQYAGPGAWNDPDMLEIGNGGMTTAEYQSEFSLWSEMAAPLIAGTDLRSISPAGLAVYENKDVIAVDQDPLGRQGTLLASADGLYALTKPLQGGDVAVALFNSTGAAATISTTAKTAGLAGRAAYQLRDLWSKKVTETGGVISAFVAPHATVMYRVSPATPAEAVRDAPSTVLSVASDVNPVQAGGRATVTVSLTDNGRTPIAAGALSLSVPSGWSVRPAGRSRGGPEGGAGGAPDGSPSGRRSVIPPGGSVSASFEVSAPTSAPPISTASLVGMVTYFSVGGLVDDASTLGLQLVSPVRAPYLTANTTGTDAVFGQSGGDFAIEAAGSGVGPATIRSAASDSYGAIYLHDVAGTSAAVQTTVTAQPGAGRTAKAGLMIRNDATSPGGSPEGVVLYVTGSRTVGMAWNAAGGATVDTSSPASAAQSYPIHLRLVRSGATYTGYYSTDGTTWTEVASATVAPAAAASLQDAALFHTAGSALPTEADFTGLSVS